MLEWKYRNHNLLMKVLNPVSRAISFLSHISWTYAHYRNGSFPFQYPDKPRLLWKKKSFFEIVKDSWEISGWEEF